MAPDVPADRLRGYNIVAALKDQRPCGNVREVAAIVGCERDSGKPPGDVRVRPAEAVRVLRQVPVGQSCP